jgi:hypothetical protein
VLLFLHRLPNGVGKGDLIATRRNSQIIPVHQCYHIDILPHHVKVQDFLGLIGQQRTDFLSKRQGQPHDLKGAFGLNLARFAFRNHVGST